MNMEFLKEWLKTILWYLGGMVISFGILMYIITLPRNIIFTIIFILFLIVTFLMTLINKP